MADVELRMAVFTIGRVVTPAQSLAVLVPPDKRLVPTTFVNIGNGAVKQKPIGRKSEFLQQRAF